MALNILESSAAVAFHRFVAFEENPRIEPYVLDYAERHHHPQSKVFMIYTFASGLSHVLMNSSYKACDMMDDVLMRKKESLTMTAVRLMGLRYRFQANACLSDMDAMTSSQFSFSNAQKIRRNAEMMTQAEQGKTAISEQDYETLGHWAMAVDRIKDGTLQGKYWLGKEAILPTTEQGLSMLLSPLLI